MHVGGGESLKYVGSEGDYWSRSLYSRFLGYTCYLIFNSKLVYSDHYNRYFGFTVRAVHIP